MMRPKKTNMVMFLPPDYDYYMIFSYRVSSQQMAFVSAMITTVLSVTTLFLYTWRLTINLSSPEFKDEVYYGVLVSISVIVFTNIVVLSLTCGLIIGVFKEKLCFVFPWIIGNITFLSIEGVATMYCNILRDHRNMGFDSLTLTAISLYICRILITVVLIVFVMKFFRDLRKRVYWNDYDEISI